jgi:hypothetical protein
VQPFFKITSAGYPANAANFTLYVRMSYYAMANYSNLQSEAVKDFEYAQNRSYDTGWMPGNGEADYFDSKLYDRLLYQIAGERPSDHAKDYSSNWYMAPFWTAVADVAGGGFDRAKRMVALVTDEPDETFSFGDGPDFTTYPVAGKNHVHGGWRAATVSPLQAANSVKGQLYPTQQVFMKSAWRDYLKTAYSGNLGALNSAWGSNYTSWDSTGTQYANETVTLSPTPDGTNIGPFTFTLAHANKVSKFTLALKNNSTLIAGDVCANRAACDNNVTSGRIWGSTLVSTSSSVNYSTGAVSIMFAPGNAPKASDTFNVSYVVNGWGYGTGLLDEDGRHTSWVGTDSVYLTGANAKFKADVDAFLYQIAKHYFSQTRTVAKQYFADHMGNADVVLLGPGSLGYWNAPPNRNVLKAAGEELDVIDVDLYPKGANFQAVVDFIGKYAGDKPLISSFYGSANADSDMYLNPDNEMSEPYATQEARGQGYYDTVNGLLNATYTVNAYTGSTVFPQSSVGTHPYVATSWFQFLHKKGESGWGLVTFSDNAFDGHESVAPNVTCSAPLDAYTCGGEAAAPFPTPYGDAITKITAGNALWQSVR